MSYTEIIYDNETQAEIDDVASDVLEGRKHLPSDPIPMGCAPRKRRLDEAELVFRAQIMGSPEYAVLTEDERENMVQARMEEYKKSPGIVQKMFDRLTTTFLSPRRDGVREEVEIKAMRRTETIRHLEESLKSRHGGGARSTHDLAISVFEHGFLSKGVPEIKRLTHQFLGSDSLLDWAYDDPCESGGPKDANGVTKSLHRLLERIDPELMIELNLKEIKRLAAMNPEGRLGQYCTIDGTAVPANVLQKQSYTKRHTELINRETEATFIKHDEAKKWRGYTLLTISCQKGTLPLVWHLTNEKPQAKHVALMLNKLYKYWPECPIKYLVGDSEFDTNELMQMLYENYGIHGQMVARENNSAGFNKQYDAGVPRCCEKHVGRNHDGLMRLRGRDGFQTPASRAEKGLLPGEHLPYSKERLRWECPRCGEKATTRPKDNPRRFTYLPLTGDSQFAALGIALGLRRNTAESMFALLKHRGVGLQGNVKARWIRNMDEMTLVIGGTFLGVTLRRVIHADGSYEHALDEAVNLKLLKYGRPQDYKPHPTLRVVPD